MAIVNITVFNDADFNCAFQYKTASGTPINITGKSMEMMLRRHAEDQAAVLRLGTDTGEIAISDPGLGKFSVRIPQASLVQLGLGDFDHSNIMSGDGNKVRIWSGILTNTAGPTR